MSDRDAQRRALEGVERAVLHHVQMFKNDIGHPSPNSAASKAAVKAAVKRAKSVGVSHASIRARVKGYLGWIGKSRESAAHRRRLINMHAQGGNKAILPAGYKMVYGKLRRVRS